MDTTKQFTAIEWCAGYGGIHLGLKRAIPNLRVIAYGEIEAFAVANLVAKMEAGLMDCAPIWSDLKTFPCEAFRDRVDLLVAGYPCQPFSAAGKRLGTEDPRHLWPHIARSIRIIRPRMCFFENVEGHISLGLREVIGELESMGYKVSWGIFSAREVGAPHQRKRVFILADRKCAGLEVLDKWDTSSEQTELVGADFGSSCQRSAWPRRPGEPQHAWEPPRVVANSILVGRRGRDHGDEGGLRGEIQTEGSCCSGGEEVVGNSSTEGLQRCGTSSEMDNKSRGAEDEGSESTPSIAFSSNAHGREAMGNAAESRCEGSRRHNDPRGSTHRPTQPDRSAGHGDMESEQWQTQPSLGRDFDGSTDRLDYAELQVSCDNRTDELRLLGNGVVPATAERAFRTLLSELNT